MSDQDRPTGYSDVGVPLDEYLTVVVPHLNRDLISDAARENLHALGRLLPVTDLAGFEFNLDNDDRRADLITRHPKSRPKIPPHLATHPVWNATARCLEQLGHPTGLLPESVNVIDLEFDLPDAPPLLPVPGIFLELNRNVELSFERLAMLATQILDSPLPEWMGATLLRCCDALPPGARVIHLGALRSRSAQQLRIVISRISSSLLIEYLNLAGWVGDSRQVTDAITGFSSLVDSMTLSLDVGRRVGDRVGIECFLEPSRDHPERWEALLQRLQHEHLCTRAKARALLAWPGSCQKGSCSAPWPPSLAWGDSLLGTAASIFVRFLSHVKLVSCLRGPLSAKAYLGFAHYWHSPSKGPTIGERGLS